MRFLVGLFFILMSHSVLAMPKVALLVSLDNPSQKPWFRSQNWSLSADLTEYFKSKMGVIPFELVIIEKADQEILHRELQNPENIALFWISHATSFNGQGKGAGYDDVIADKYGNNVKDVFQRIHPNLKYLSILGCKAKAIFDELKKNHFFDHNLGLEIYAKAENINAKKEIKNSIKDFKIKLEQFNELPTICGMKRGLPITITRKIPLNVDPLSLPTSAKVLQQGKLLGMFPKAAPGESQELTVHIDSHQELKNQELKLVLDSGNLSKSHQLLLGDLEIHTNAFSGSWKPFQDVKGKNIGINQHIYRYEGSTQIQQDPIGYFPFQCNKINSSVLRLRNL